MESLILIDATSGSLTISSPEVQGAERYVLQYRKADWPSFETLSQHLASPEARKKNLSGNSGFFFRIGACCSGDQSPDHWASHCEPFYLLPENVDKQRLAPPEVFLEGIPGALGVKWEPFSTSCCCSYEVQMRENRPGTQWTPLATTGSHNLLKKDLSPKAGYQFRVRPNVATIPFSSPSKVLAPLCLSQGMKRFFSSLDHGTLLQNLDQQSTSYVDLGRTIVGSWLGKDLAARNNEVVSLSDAIGGKEFVLLYQCAHYCQGCRAFTEALSQWYLGLGATKLTLEVVFISKDRNRSDFVRCCRNMPWLAVNYDDSARKQLNSRLGGSTIPRLAVVDCKTGRIIDGNVLWTKHSLDVKHWRELATLTESIFSEHES